MKKRIFLFIFCLILFLSVEIQAQIKKSDNLDLQDTLPEIQVSPWNLEYEIKLKNIQNSQFADIIRKRLLNSKRPLSEEEIQKRKIAFGEERIKSRKAATTFKFDPDLTLKDYLLLQSDSSELRQIVEQNADTCLKMFHKNLRDFRLSQNDIADASALAFTLSYEILFGEKLSRAHLNWMRKKGREILLKSASFQGVDDAERQRTFEIYGVLTMYAKILQERSFKGDKDAQIESKETADEVLRQIWGNSTETIQKLPVGFIHKGQKVILDGKATQFFNFNYNLQTAKKISAGNSQIATQYQLFLNQVYKEMFRKKMPNNDLATCGTYSLAIVYPLLSGLGELNNNQLNGVYETF